MKRFVSSVMMTGVLGLAAYTFSGAHPPARGPEGRRGGPGGPRAGIGLLRDANLSEEQKAAIKAIRGEESPAAIGEPAEARLRRELQAEVFADAPDAGKIASLQQQLAQSQASRLARQIETEQKIAQVLTAEQRAKVRERLSQAPSERRAPRAERERAPRQ